MKAKVERRQLDVYCKFQSRKQTAGDSLGIISSILADKFSWCFYGVTFVKGDFDSILYGIYEK